MRVVIEEKPFGKQWFANEMGRRRDTKISRSICAIGPAGCRKMALIRPDVPSAAMMMAMFAGMSAHGLTAATARGGGVAESQAG